MPLCSVRRVPPPSLLLKKLGGSNFDAFAPPPPLRFLSVSSKADKEGEKERVERVLEIYSKMKRKEEG